MDVRPACWVTAALLACASGPRGSDAKLDELGRAAERCTARLAPVVATLPFPPSVDPALEGACEPVWTLRAELTDGFEPPTEYRLLLAYYLNLSTLYEIGENRDLAGVERTLLRALRVAEDTRTDPASRAYMYARLAGLYREDRPDEHERVFRKALDLAEQSGDLELCSSLRLQLAGVRKEQGNLAEARALANQGVALLEERVARIEGGEDVENSRVRGPEPQASQRRRELGLANAKRRLADARKLLADIERCQGYASAFEPDEAVQCCRDGEVRRYFDPQACRLPGDALP
jgi:tetratricopeptide (TPR) repeat protein